MSAQDRVRLLNESGVYGFHIEVLFWDRLQDTALEHPDIIRTFYPQLISTNQKIIEFDTNGDNPLESTHGNTKEVHTLIEAKPFIFTTSELVDELSSEVKSLTSQGHWNAAATFLTNKIEQLPSSITGIDRAKAHLELANVLATLQKFKEATKELFSAYRCAPDWENAAVGQVQALLYESKLQKAIPLLDELLGRYPQNLNAHGLKIIGQCETGQAPPELDSLPPAVSASDYIKALTAFAWQRVGENDKAIETANLVGSENHLPLANKVKALAYLARALEQLRVPDPGHLPTDFRHDLEEAAALFEQERERLKNTDLESLDDTDIAPNLFTIYRLLERQDAAIELDKSVDLSTIKQWNILSQVVMSRIERGTPDSALEALENFDSDSEEDLLQRDILTIDALRIVHRSEESLDLANRLLASGIKETPDRAVVASQKIAALTELGRLDEAIEFGASESEQFDTEPQVYIELGLTLFENNQTNEATKTLTKANDLLQDRELNHLHLKLAKAFAITGMHNQACDLFRKIINPSLDSSMLRSYVINLINADRRHQLKDVLTGLDSITLNKAFFKRANIHLALLMGDYAEAVDLSAEYFNQYPHDLAAAGYLLCSARLAHQKEKASEVLSYLDSFPLEPADARLSLLGELTKGEWLQEALEFGLQTYRSHRTNADVNQAFFSTVLLANDTAEPPETVTSHCGVVITDLGDKKQHTYSMNPGVNPDISANELTDQHPLFPRLRNCRPGDVIEATPEENPISKKYRIDAVIPRYVKEFREIGNNFGKLFPSDTRLQSFNPYDESNNLRLEPFLEIAKSRRQYSEQIIEKYKSGGLPITTVATALSHEPFTLWKELQWSKDVRPLYASGSEESRKRSIDSIRDGNKL